MLGQAAIELRDPLLPVLIGTCGPEDVVPDPHVLDLDLTISSDPVKVTFDDLDSVFDYDPLIEQIVAIAKRRTFETQEFLIILITQACMAYREILALEICLRKSQGLAGTGSLWVRLVLGAEDLTRMRRNSD